jgi:hypothetical protein
MSVIFPNATVLAPGDISAATQGERVCIDFIVVFSGFWRQVSQLVEFENFNVFLR